MNTTIKKTRIGSAWKFHTEGKPSVYVIRNNRMGLRWVITQHGQDGFEHIAHRRTKAEAEALARTILAAI